MFKVGDKVEAFGLKGEVICITKADYAVEVMYDNGNTDIFTSDGLSMVYHKTPSLKLIERPQQKRTVKMMPALIFDRQLNQMTISDQIFESLEKATESYFNNRRKVIKLIESMSVDVEFGE